MFADNGSGGNGEALISKKDVLEMTGISYGQLYRWKRKGLIPESWFLRRSTYTGQGTFFPRDKIIRRIERIKEMKPEHPLDELADLITQTVSSGLEVALSHLEKLGWIDDEVSKVCGMSDGDDQTISLRDALCLGALKQITAVATEQEMGLVSETLENALGTESFEDAVGETPELFLGRKKVAAAGISADISLAVVATEGTTFDSGIDIVRRVNLQEILERIKWDMGQKGNA